MVLISESFTLIISDLAPGIKIRLLLLKVVFVADKDNGESLICKAFGLINPFLKVFEGVFIGDVVDKDGADGASVVGAGDGLEDLLACLLIRKGLQCPRLGV